jgi:urease accessory protein
MTRSKAFRATITGLAMAALPCAAMAHPAAGEMHGLSHGFMHPVAGVDHVLAMVMVGLIAARIGGRALWVLPLSFVVMMAVGGAFAMAGTGFPMVEILIGLSVVAFGAMLALKSLLTVQAAIGITAIFALFHGAAHGAEMPVGASSLEYAAGFMMATAGLHAAGILAGLGFARFSASTAMRLSGAVTALAGIGFVANLY